MIHLLAPFVSGKKIIVDKDKSKEKQKKNMLIKIRFLIEKLDKKQKIKKPKKQKMKCFLSPNFEIGAAQKECKFCRF